MFRWTRFLAAALLLAGCGGDIVRDSAELERALVPAFDLTHHGEPGPARAALAELLPAWDEFSARYRDHRPEAPGWAEGFAEIDTLVADIADLVEDDEDLPLAAASLLDMWMILAELREEAGIEHYLDLLLELWDPVEELDGLARRRTPDGVAAGDLLALESLLGEFYDVLDHVVETGFDVRRYDFDPARTAELERRLDELADTADALDRALEDDDPAAALRAARGLMPRLFEVYRLFGDYNLPEEPGE